MTYTTAEGRQQCLEELANATNELGTALAVVGELYEQLDEINADRLEEALFRPIQGAYGRARRTHAEFSARIKRPAKNFVSQKPGAPSHDHRDAVDRAVEAVEEADSLLAELQDSMLPVEVGDREFRTGLADVRTQIGPIPMRAREFVRTLGR